MHVDIDQVALGMQSTPVSIKKKPRSSKYLNAWGKGSSRQSPSSSIVLIFGEWMQSVHNTTYVLGNDSYTFLEWHLLNPRWQVIIAVILGVVITWVLFDWSISVRNSWLTATVTMVNANIHVRWKIIAQVIWERVRPKIGIPKPKIILFCHSTQTHALGVETREWIQIISFPVIKQADKKLANGSV